MAHALAAAPALTAPSATVHVVVPSASPSRRSWVTTTSAGIGGERGLEPLDRRPALAEKVARRGFHVSREYAIDELEILFVRDVMRSDVVVLRAEAPLSEALATIVTRAELAATAADPAHLDRALAEFARRPVVIGSSATLRTAVQRMAEAGVTRLLVVNPAARDRLVGKVALHDLLKARARPLEDEQRRERILPWEYILPKWIRPRLDREPRQ